MIIPFHSIPFLYKLPNGPLRTSPF